MSDSIRRNAIKSQPFVAFLFMLLFLCVNPTLAKGYISTPVDSGNSWKYLRVRTSDGDTFSIIRTTVTITNIEKNNGILKSLLVHWVDSIRTIYRYTSGKEIRNSVVDTVRGIVYDSTYGFIPKFNDLFMPFLHLKDTAYLTYKMYGSMNLIEHYDEQRRGLLIYNTDTLRYIYSQYDDVSPSSSTAVSDSIILMEKYGIIVSTHRYGAYAGTGKNREHCTLESFNNTPFDLAAVHPLPTSIHGPRKCGNSNEISAIWHGSILGIALPDVLPGQSFSLALHDMAGRKFITEKFKGNQEIRINLKSLRAGAYLVTIKSGSELFRRKIIVP